MRTRQKDRTYARYIGPADRLHGEFRGQPVELLAVGDDGPRVRFPDGTTSRVLWDHITDALFKLEVAP